MAVKINIIEGSSKIQASFYLSSEFLFIQDRIQFKIRDLVFCAHLNHFFRQTHRSSPVQIYIHPFTCAFHNSFFSDKLIYLHLKMRNLRHRQLKTNAVNQTKIRYQNFTKKTLKMQVAF